MPLVHTVAESIGTDQRPAAPELAAPAARLAARTLAGVVLAYRIVAGGLLAAGCLGQLVLIVLRNLASVEPAWAPVAATLSLAVGGLLFIGLCPAHIGFRLVGDRLPGPVLVVRGLVGAAITGAIAYEGVRAALDQKALGSTFQSFDFPVWIAMLAIPVSATALTARFAADAVTRVRRAG